MGKKLAVKCTRLLRVCCGKADCPAKSTDGFLCCRDAGHKGPHIACSHVAHSVAVWYDVEKIKDCGACPNGACPRCGGRMLGDGVKEVLHCEGVEDLQRVWESDPDGNPIFCDVPDEG